MPASRDHKLCAARDKVTKLEAEHKAVIRALQSARRDVTTEEAAAYREHECRAVDTKNMTPTPARASPTPAAAATRVVVRDPTGPLAEPAAAAPQTKRA